MGFKGPHRIDKGHLGFQGSHVALPGYAVEYRAQENICRGCQTLKIRLGPD